MLFRAVRNPAKNALRHTPSGTVVEIHVTVDETISVMDKGERVPKNERDMIFRRFWRRDRNHSEGAGLGLAIVARIVEVHAGTIVVRDLPSGGAMFSISLPLA